MYTTLEWRLIECSYDHFFCPFILEGKKGTLYNSGTFHNKVMLPTLDRCPNYCSIFLSFISHQSLIQPCTLTVLFTFSPHSKLYTLFQELANLLSSQNAPEYLPALSEKEVSTRGNLASTCAPDVVLSKRTSLKNVSVIKFHHF